MHSFGTEFLRKILSALIIFQIAFSPLAIADDKTPPSEESLPAIPGSDPKAEQLLHDSLYENLMGRSSDYNPLDYFSLLRQDFVPENAKKVKSISPSSVLFRVLDSNSRTLKQFAAGESLHNNFDGLTPENNEKFQLFLQGRLVHDFRVPVEALGVLGNYIVFIEKGSFNAQENFRHISFIDLDYFRLAKNELPIFRVPVHGVENINSFRIHKGVLYINEKAYERGLFDFSANLNRILFNIAVNVTEPGQLIRILQALEPFIEAFNANLAAAGKQTNDQELKQNLELTLKNQLTQLEKMKSTADSMNEEELKKLSETFEKPIMEAMGKVHENLKNERTLIGRLGHVWQEMTIPRPAEVGTLKSKVVKVAISLKRKTAQPSDFYELAKEFATNPYIHLTIDSVLVGAAVAFFSSDHRAVLASLEMVAQLGSYVSGKAVDLVDLAYRTGSSTLSGFNPMKVYETYIADGAWKRTSVGVTAMFSILALVVGIPHVILNTYYLMKDFKNSPTLNWRSEDGKLRALDFIKKIIPNFVRRQQDLQRNYLEALSADKKKGTGEDFTVSTEEFTKIAREFIQKMEAHQRAQEQFTEFSLRTKIWGAISLFTEVQLPTFVKVTKWTTNQASTQWNKFKNIESFTGALAHFIFSFASFTKSAIFYAFTWNYFYMARLLVLHPRMATTFFFYPNFFRRAVATELGQVTPPSFWNGGDRWVWQEISVQMRRASHAEKYERLKQFENSVVPVEKEIGKVALKYSLQALTKYLDYDMDKLVELSEKPGVSKKLSAKDISSLSYDARTFFSSYYDILVEKAMRNYLLSQASTHTIESVGSSPEQIKKWFVDNNQKVIPGLLDPKQLVEAQLTEENYKKAFDRVHGSLNFFSKMRTANMHHTIRSLDSETNGKIRRFVIAEQQMKKASAMARAVRANIVAMLVDKPMELALLFVLTAGITDGPNKPLFEEMFGPNSAFYLSRNVFMAYLSGLLVSIFADVWVKIQQDTRVDKLGGFDQVPEGEHAKKGFWSWYRYQFTHNKNNKWWDHHKYNSEIIFHNMGPAFILMTITGLATLGRVDLDFYFLGYMTAFFLPFSGLSLKLEQTFEIASGWVLRDVPEKLRNHPLVLEWANKRIMKLRMGFQIYYKLYENILGQFISNLMAITTVRNGTRALSRILFGGKTITEHIIEKTTASANAVPMTKFVDNACRFLFATNYSSGPLPPKPK